MTCGPLVSLAMVGAGWLYELCTDFPGIEDMNNLDLCHVLMSVSFSAVQLCSMSELGWMWVPLVSGGCGIVGWICNMAPSMVARAVVQDRMDERAQTFEGAMRVAERRLKNSGDYVEYQNTFNELVSRSFIH